MKVLCPKELKRVEGMKSVIKSTELNLVIEKLKVRRLEQALVVMKATLAEVTG